MIEGKIDTPTPIEEWAPARGWIREVLYGRGQLAGSALRGTFRPLGWTWAVVAERGLHGAPSARLKVPVISVGNVTVGGGGKTSLVRWLIEQAVPDGKLTGVLIRGYGRSRGGIRVLSPGRSEADASGVGDEALLLARAGAWVGVGSDRVRAAAAVADRARPDLFLLDDGLQHRKLARSLDLVTFTRDGLEAPARCLPAGPLRTMSRGSPPNAAWVTVEADPRERNWPAGSIGQYFARWWREMPGSPATWCDRGTVPLDGWWREEMKPFDSERRPIVAFAGVAHPESVGRFAQQAGFPAEKVVAFPDHHRYTPRQISDLLTRHPGAALLMTEKDAVKCRPEWFQGRPAGVMRRALEPRDGDLLRDLVREAAGWAA